jgi:endoglucanase
MLAIPLLRLLVLVLPAAAAAAVLPAPAAPLARPVLRRGWNLGDTLDTNSNKPGVSAPWVFDTVRKSGFDWVRIPVQWGPHTATAPPFKIQPAFMTTVRQTVEWALRAGLVAMVNTHHEDWLDNRTTFDAQLPRLLSIWEQISTEFASLPTTALVFELFNEPSNINLSQLNAMNAAVLPVVRKHNPTRQVHLGGLAKMGTWWILQNPDGMQIPAGDSNLALTVHSYSPWDFAGPGPQRQGPTNHVFTAADEATAHATMSSLAKWGQRKLGDPRRVVHDEFGCTVMQSNRTARLLYYKTYRAAAEAAGVGWAIWDDDGWYRVLSRRGNHTWDAEVLAQLVPS